ncbi:hypothetical protein Drorol1_Dr00004709 [Drosera rotundifolia]
MGSAADIFRTTTKRLVRFGLRFLPGGFSSSKCKTWAKMTTARIKLLRNKREAMIRQMRRDVALLLQSGQEATARIRVEHVIREQNAMAANEIIELFCDQIVTRLSIISKQRQCPADLKEGIASLIFAAPRCSDIPELLSIRDIFEKKYGKDFVSAAMDLRPDSGVNRLLIEKLSVRNPKGELKLKEGPRTFVSAASLPLKSHTLSSPRDTETGNMHYQDAAAAAKAAADSANKALAAAQAAAQLAGTKSCITVDNANSNALGVSLGAENVSNPSKFPPSMSNEVVGKAARFSDSWSSAGSHGASNRDPGDVDCKKIDRSHSYNAPSAGSGIQFDESDCDEEVEMETPFDGMNQPPVRAPPPRVPAPDAKQDRVPRVHPNLPDYDALTARFEALKYSKPRR